MEKRLYTTLELSKICAISRQQIVQDIRLGKLGASKISGRYLIEPKQLQNYPRFMKLLEKEKANQ